MKGLEKFNYFLLSYRGSIGVGSVIIRQTNNYISQGTIEDGKKHMNIGDNVFVESTSYLGEMTEEEFKN